MIIKGNIVGHPLPDPRKGLEMQGGINMNGHDLTGISDPANENDAVNLKTLNAAVDKINKLQFTGVTVAASKFVDNTTYEDFPKRAAVSLSGVTASMIPEVIFGLADAIGGNFAPVAETYDGGVYIYAADVPKADVTIPTIICWKGDA